MYTAHVRSNFAGNRADIGDRTIFSAITHNQDGLKILNTMYDTLINVVIFSNPAQASNPGCRSGASTDFGQPTVNPSRMLHSSGTWQHCYTLAKRQDPKLDSST